MAIGKPGLGDIPPKQLAQDIMLLGVPTLRAIVKSTLDLAEEGKLTGYYSDPITKNGDPTVLKQRTRSAWWQLKIREPVSHHALQRIKEFREDVEAKEATLMLGLSWIYGSPDETTLNTIRKIIDELDAIAPLLYDRESLNVKTDSSLFADTHYHLNSEGRRIRTTELVQQLNAIAILNDS
jgi:hypothetical protein